MTNATAIGLGVGLSCAVFVVVLFVFWNYTRNISKDRNRADVDNMGGGEGQTENGTRKLRREDIHPSPQAPPHVEHDEDARYFTAAKLANIGGKAEGH
ncbi:hypothetical protein SISSUDRAFT_1061945 [Sistotremastrum suecicum HHB10207 ss-3]|uniref:Uncharacterized protein n=1 Tax=Sistotremastrum suecicum HHB10207 ss-3 TaxID=1314776 RepID=A0A166DFS0_9AGAM|nr:hypothetical protein SISSUDRAFT_1061945 [Sistotremastrum suecicum HHB10207 ss-3]